MEESVKQKTFAHRLSLMSALLLLCTHQDKAKALCVSSPVETDLLFHIDWGWYLRLFKERDSIASEILCVCKKRDLSDIVCVFVCVKTKGQKRQGMCEWVPNNSVGWAFSVEKWFDQSLITFPDRCTYAYTKACCDRLHWKFFQDFTDTLTVYQLDRQIPECLGKHANAPPRILQVDFKGSDLKSKNVRALNW